MLHALSKGGASTWLRWPGEEPRSDPVVSEATWRLQLASGPVQPGPLTEKLGLNKSRAFVQGSLTRVCRLLLYIFLSETFSALPHSSPCHQLSCNFPPRLHAMFFFYPECERHSVGCKMVLEAEMNIAFLLLNNQIFLFVCFKLSSGLSLLSFVDIFVL